MKVTIYPTDQNKPTETMSVTAIEITTNGLGEHWIYYHHEAGVTGNLIAGDKSIRIENDE